MRTGRAGGPEDKPDTSVCAAALPKIGVHAVIDSPEVIPEKSKGVTASPKMLHVAVSDMEDNAVTLTWGGPSPGPGSCNDDIESGAASDIASQGDGGTLQSPSFLDCTSSVLLGLESFLVLHTVLAARL